MAERRMLSKQIMYQDKLADLSPTAQLLYVYLNLEADDDGFVANPRMIVGMARAQNQDLQQLLDSGYLLRFDSGVVVITHWPIHNQIRKDRYKPTRFQREFSRLQVADGCYALTETDPDTIGTPALSHCEPQDKISKDKLSKDKLSEDKLSKDKTDDTRERESNRSSSSSYTSYTDFENMILELYQRCCPGLPAYEFLSEELRKHIAQLEKAGWTGEYIEKAFRAAQGSEYLKGGGKDGWKADLGWLCKDDNLQKVLSGKYRTYSAPPDNRKSSSKPIYGCNPLGEAELEAIERLLREDDANYRLPDRAYS